MAGPGQGYDPAHAGWQATPPVPPDRPRRRRWPIIVLVGLLLLAGCGTVVAVVGYRFAGSMSAPIDAANEYVDAAREGSPVSGLTCGDGQGVDPRLETSRGQRLMSVEVRNNRVAYVTGSVTLDDGDRTPITVILQRAGDSWCVSEARF